MTTVGKYNNCWFSKADPAFKHMNVYEVFLIDPGYILWCYETFDGVQFDQELITLLSGYKKAMEIKADWLTDD